MSKLKDLNLNQILSKVNIKFKLVDINRFCTNVELEKKISEIAKKSCIFAYQLSYHMQQERIKAETE